MNIKLKVLSLNTWQQCTNVEGGFDALLNIIIDTKSNIVLLSEIRNYYGKIFSDDIIEKLKNNGHQFYSYNSSKSPLILSKFPIESVDKIDSNQLTKCVITLYLKKNNTTINIAVYAAHLDYTHYACYLPRGYDGISWRKLSSPVLNVEEILTQNMASKRGEAIDIFIKDALKEKEKGNIVIFGGDFNEPSHLDWTHTMKDRFDHNGTVICWPQSDKLLNSGFMDCYRERYPNPVKFPGITWPAYNKHVIFDKLIWAKDADERERIDFIYYYKDKRISVQDVVIVGPIGSIANGKIIQSNTGNDTFIIPKGVWPSDHKGVLATFNLNL